MEVGGAGTTIGCGVGTMVGSSVGTVRPVKFN